MAHRVESVVLQHICTTDVILLFGDNLFNENSSMPVLFVVDARLAQKMLHRSHEDQGPDRETSGTIYSSSGMESEDEKSNDSN